LNDWLSNNYNELKNICSKFSTPEEVDDLLHLCIEQFINNKKVHQIPDKEKLYFFTKIVRNQYHSKSSKYHYTYRRYQFNEIVENDISDIEYEESKFDMDWVIKQIEEDKKNGEWYFSRLFEIYIEQDCSVTKTSKKTSIPINSVSRDLNKYRKQLKLRRNNER
jgi:hypothetical protein